MAVTVVRTNADALSLSNTLSIISGSVSLLRLNLDTTSASVSAINSVPSGTINSFAGFSAPSGWLLCSGQSVSRTTYSNLFNTLTELKGSFTVTIGTGATATLNNHGLETGTGIYLTTTGALPTGLIANTMYYVIYVSANTFKFATSLTNAIAGTAVNTSGTQSGTHSLISCPYGNGDGSTTFNIPDLRGRSIFGKDNMGGSAASRITSSGANNSGIAGSALGASGGDQKIHDHDHSASSVAETQDHVHEMFTAANPGGGGPAYRFDWNYDSSGGFAYPQGINGGGRSAAHTHGITVNKTTFGGTSQNMPPTMILNYIIKT